MGGHSPRGGECPRELSRRGWRNVVAREILGLEKKMGGVLASNSISWDTILYHKD